MRLLIGKTLAGLREQRQLSQLKVAKHIAVSRSTYGGWEKDRGCPTFLQVYSMLNLYEISIQELTSLIEQENTDQNL